MKITKMQQRPIFYLVQDYVSLASRVLGPRTTLAELTVLIVAYELTILNPGRVNVRDVAKVADLPYSTVSAILRRWVQKEFLATTYDPDDLRGTVYYSPNGAKYELFQRCSDEWLAKLQATKEE